MRRTEKGFSVQHDLSLAGEVLQTLALEDVNACPMGNVGWRGLLPAVAESQSIESRNGKGEMVYYGYRFGGSV
ncbi:MAG: hypothetical protein MI923_17235 [Phycisphaerales bacterium]|nr:hypothetical protein [Phycisphaerales bacterium]